MVANAALIWFHTAVELPLLPALTINVRFTCESTDTSVYFGVVLLITDACSGEPRSYRPEK
jgi:hypothetical protein